MTVNATPHAPSWTFSEAIESADPADVGRWGGKGAGLARMIRNGLRVPPGYVISTGACRQYLEADALPAGLVFEVTAQLAALEERSGKTFGRGPVPLLLSVRSGAPVSMPGMMDTILNLGLGREAAVALAEATGDTRFIAELTARFHAMYSEIVLGALDVDDGVREVVERVRPGDPPGESYDRVWAACERALFDDTGDSVPAEPTAQLLGAVEAVFRSWNTSRARTYREFHGIAHDLGTAVVVQSMVFGNTGADSGSGVVFTRNPVTGEPGLFGEYLANSQGEDVVAGLRNPDPVREALAPALLDELTETCAGLEAEYGDLLDIEFTVERSTLYFLQVRVGKRTPEAAVRIAADLLSEGMVGPERALSLVSPEQVRQVQRPGFDAGEVGEARAGGRLLATGIGACPGQVSGVLVLDPDRAKAAAERGEAVVLARTITSPADLHGMIAAQGLVTATGGSTSHAAVVARALGTACVVGASDLQIDERARTLRVGERTLVEGGLVSLDGSTGELFAGGFATATPATASSALTTLLTASSAAAGCEVLGRVALPAQVEEALAAGASGVLAAVDDVLAATGDLGHIRGMLDHDEDCAALGLTGVADLVARAFTPVLASAGTAEVIVPAIDVLADRPGEPSDWADIVGQRPHLAVPLGLPALLEAQLEGLTRALDASGRTARVRLVVRRICDPAEAHALRELATRSRSRSSPAVGVVLTSPRAVFHAVDIAQRCDAKGCDALWVDLCALHAAAFGVPQRALLAPELLDGYLRRGLFGSDPRSAIDPSVADLLDRFLPVGRGVLGEGRVGVHLPGEVHADVVATLYRTGVRRYAVDATELRPVLLMIGWTALGS
jgi:pyruvate, orthophosphate dikinase